jgi:hypothetical protein
MKWERKRPREVEQIEMYKKTVEKEEILLVKSKRYPSNGVGARFIFGIWPN